MQVCTSVHPSYVCHYSTQKAITLRESDDGHPTIPIDNIMSIVPSEWISLTDNIEGPT
ncbi:hypothetical protein ABKN59_002938 [Abortiporus biennis]